VQKTDTSIVVITFKLPELLRKQIKQRVLKGEYVNASDFLREAVRAKLKERS